ncbi:methylesterase 17-like [Mangifera indica]|uniref:methylesterase 17-like n=1 Tax=Mangifera indica TaxID=29780 RepID=UPI001CFAA455|nr:methylesterase 17-like [Mangifera indica]
MAQGVPDLSQFGDVYEFGFGLGGDQPPTSAIVKEEFQRKIIYQMSPPEDSTLAAMLLKPGPILALTSARFSQENESVESVPRVYIKTLNDNVLKAEQQDAMIKRWPPSDVYVLESDHSPFFSTPFLLFGLLIKAAASFGYCI